MTWSTAVVDLRNYVGDGPKDKIAWRKNAVGYIQDGSNQIFKTFDGRRTTDFTIASAPEGVYVNGTIQTVDSDDLVFGEFKLHTAPANGTRIETTYYYQYFLDSDLTQFLTSSCQWLGLGDDYTQIESGLRPASLDFGASKAYQKAAMLLATQMNQVFKITNTPDTETYRIIESYLKASESYLKSAQENRAGFYTRQDQPLAPLFGNNIGVVTDVPPNR